MIFSNIIITSLNEKEGEKVLRKVRVPIWERCLGEIIIPWRKD